MARRITAVGLQDRSILWQVYLQMVAQKELTVHN